MRFIDPHIHMSARTTDDYERMAAAGIVAIIEPAFWLGQPRTQVGSYIDYMSSLVGWERFRAAQFGIRHYCTIGLNSKEANNEGLAEQVLEVLPRYLMKEGVVAVGEIGYDDQTPVEDKYYRAQISLAKEFDMLVQVHTPHRDKKSGTTRSMVVAIEMGMDPERVVIDHNNEETVQEVLDRGFGVYIEEPYARMVSAITGFDVTVEELERVGERVINLERVFNVREGVRRKDDVLPWKVMHEPIPDGPSAGMFCPPDELSAMLDEYYRLRGWTADGVPGAERLASLRL